jgi:hypothetical protein
MVTTVTLIFVIGALLSASNTVEIRGSKAAFSFCRALHQQNETNKHAAKSSPPQIQIIRLFSQLATQVHHRQF